jgi:hypothetical protein
LFEFLAMYGRDLVEVVVPISSRNSISPFASKEKLDVVSSISPFAAAKRLREMDDVAGVAYDPPEPDTIHLESDDIYFPDD